MGIRARTCGAGTYAARYSSQLSSLRGNIPVTKFSRISRKRGDDDQKKTFPWMKCMLQRLIQYIILFTGFPDAEPIPGEVAQ